MSKYVKELMMDQLRSDLDGSRSVLILDLKGLDAISEHQFRSDLRKKSIKVRALKNTLARRVFTDMGIGGLSKYLEGPSVAVWGGDGVAELAKEVCTQVKTLKKPEIKGGAVDGVVIGPDAGRGHHQAAQPRGPDRPGRRPGPGPRAAGRLAGQRAGRRPDEPAQDPVRRARPRARPTAEAAPKPAEAPAAEGEARAEPRLTRQGACTRASGSRAGRSHRPIQGRCR